MSKAKAKYRDRIQELVRVPASELIDNPDNPREHGSAQRAAMAGILGEVGWVDGLIAVRGKDKKLRLVNGHLRKGIAGDELVPVLVVDLTPAEAKKVLATFDPVGAMATVSAEGFRRLYDELKTKDEAVKKMLADLAEKTGAIAPNFSPVSIDDQSRLDEKSKHVCPKCGHEF